MPIQRRTGVISTRSAEAMRRGLVPTAFRAPDSASFMAEASAAWANRSRSTDTTTRVRPSPA